MIEYSKQKKEKNSKKLKNTIAASLKAKIGTKWPRRRENKIIASFRSYPMRSRKFHKNSKKFQKIKKYHYGFVSIQNRLEEAEKNRK